MALIDYTNTLPAGDGYQSLSVISSSGAVYADDHPNRQLMFRGGTASAEATDEGLLPIVNLLQSFIDCVLTDDDPPPAVAWWRQVHELAVAVRQSLETARAVLLEGR
jgi:predicted dehydrogenase